MSLLVDAISVLETAHIPHALIGAAALALHAVSRSTADVDLLTVDPRTLDANLWDDLGGRCDSMRVLRGDSEDPLAGTVRVMRSGEIVDVVVGRYVWQKEIIDAAQPMSVGEVTLPVVRPAGLILLKLLAGGAKDAWDIRALLDVVPSPDVVRNDVETVLPRLPPDARRLWNRVAGGE